MVNEQPTYLPMYCRCWFTHHLCYNWASCGSNLEGRTLSGIFAWSSQPLCLHYNICWGQFCLHCLSVRFVGLKEWSRRSSSHLLPTLWRIVSNSSFLNKLDSFTNSCCQCWNTPVLYCRVLGLAYMLSGPIQNSVYTNTNSLIQHEDHFSAVFSALYL